MASKTGAFARRGGAGPSERRLGTDELLNGEFSTPTFRTDANREADPALPWSVADQTPVRPRDRQPSMDAASSSSDLSYVTLPPELHAGTRPRNAVGSSLTGAKQRDSRYHPETGLGHVPPRAPSPFNSPPPVTAAQASAGLPPSAFTLTGASPRPYTLPPVPELSLHASTSRAEGRSAQGYRQPPSRLTSLHAIVQQEQLPAQADPAAIIDRWRARVDAETKSAGKRASSSSAYVPSVAENADSLTNDGPASVDAVRPASSLSPALPSKRKKVESTAATKATLSEGAKHSKRASKRKRPEEKGHPPAESPERAISSKALVKMLPKRRKVFGRAKENEAEAVEDETDYECARLAARLLRRRD